MFYRPLKIDESIANTYYENQVSVLEVKEKYIIVKDEVRKYIIYIKEDQIFNEKDILFVKGECLLLEKDLDIDVFEFKDYLNNKRIYYQIDSYEINTIKNKNKLNNKMIYFLTSKLTDDSLNMTKMLLFNDKSIDKESYENLKEINAVHLFVVSGFHISFIFSLINHIFKKNKTSSLIISFIICGFYIYLLNFSYSALRAFLTLFLYELFKNYLNRLDCLSIAGIIILLIEPLNVFDYSFIMSFVLSFTITLSSKSINKYNKIIQTLLLSVICFLVMIPIQLSLNYEINFISLISNVILSYVVIVIFIFCIYGMLLSIFDGNIFGIIYDKFNDFVSYLSSLNTSIVFGKMNPFIIVIYYLLLLFLLLFFEKRSKKLSLVFFNLILLLMIIFYNKNYLISYQQVTFLNVYQGDCVIIQDSFSNKVMMIDTGGLQNYDIASKKIIPYLKTNGIRKIDTIVITHDDYDHNGALESLLTQIKVDNVIVDNTIKEINVGKITLSNINQYALNSKDENDGSIVLYGNIAGYDFLFTGDISSKIEKQILNDYNINIDVLKVAHHGSNTSSSEEFISYYKPDYAIISVGKNNIYNHPSDKVIDVLNKYNIKIYRTDEDGTIRFKGKIFDFCFIQTAK